MQAFERHHRKLVPLEIIPHSESVGYAVVHKNNDLGRFQEFIHYDLRCAYNKLTPYKWNDYKIKPSKTSLNMFQNSLEDPYDPIFIYSSAYPGFGILI